MATTVMDGSDAGYVHVQAPQDESAEMDAATTVGTNTAAAMQFHIDTEFTEGGYLQTKAASAIVVPSIRAPAAQTTEERTPMCLTLVVDVSGSMAGEKIKLVAKTIEFVASKLSDRDMLGIIAYDTHIYEKLKLTFMTNSGKELACSAARALRSGSTTNLSGGLFAGIRQQLAQRVIDPRDEDRAHTPPRPVCKKMRSPAKKPAPSKAGPFSLAGWFGGASAVQQNQTATEQPQLQAKAVIPFGAPTYVQTQEHEPDTSAPADLDGERTLIPSGMIRAIHLFTDGHANHGETNMDLLAEKASHMLDGTTPISVSTFGFGADHNEEALQKLALCGGEYNFIPNATAISRSFGSALGGLLSTIAQQVYVELEAVTGAFIEAPLDPELARKMERLNSGGVRVPLDDICSEEQRDVPFRVSLPANAPDAQLMARLKYTDVSSSEAVAMEATEVLKRVASVDSNVINVEVEAQRLRLEAATLMEEAELAARTGDGEKARGKLAEAEQQILSSPAHKSPMAANLLQDVREAQRYSSDVRMMGKAAAMSKGCARKQKGGAAFATPTRHRVSRQAEAYTNSALV